MSSTNTLNNLPSQCDSYPPGATGGDVGDMAQGILSKLSGASQGCDISSFYAAMGGSASLPLGMGNAEFSAQANTLKKSGCQVLQALVGNYINSCFQAKCIIENIESANITTVTVTQSINITASGGSTIYNTQQCPPGSSYTESATVNGKVINNLQSNTLTQIKNIVQQGLKNTATQVGQIKDGYQDTGSGVQALEAIQNKLLDTSQTTNVNNNITTINNNFSTTQTISLEAIVGSTLGNVIPCNLSEQSAINLQIAAMISNAYSTDLMSSIANFMSSKEGQTTSYIATGAPDVVGEMFKNNWMYIVGVIAAIILGVFLLKYMKGKNGKITLPKSAFRRRYL